MSVYSNSDIDFKTDFITVIPIFIILYRRKIMFSGSRVVAVIRAFAVYTKRSLSETLVIPLYLW